MSDKTKVDYLKERLTKLLEKDGGLVIALNGEWGVGKTQFLNNYKKTELTGKTVTYTSLSISHEKPLPSSRG